MYLLDTNIVSELRRGPRANPGVRRFVEQLSADNESTFLSVLTIGELQRGVLRIRSRGDVDQANLLSDWVQDVARSYADNILAFALNEALLWGHLSSRTPGTASGTVVDLQLAATAISYGLTLVTRNTRDFVTTGVRLLNPFVE